MIKKLKQGLCGFLACTLLSSALPRALAEQTDAQWEEIQSIMSGFQKWSYWDDPSIYSGAITQTIPNTAILGNGNIGVTSYGSDTEKTYLLSSTDFWSDNAQAIGYSGRSPQILTGGGLTVKAANNSSTEGNTDLALGAYVMDVSSETASNPAYRAVNGVYEYNDDSQSEPFSGWVSEIGQTQYITIDLGMEKRFNRYHIKHDNFTSKKGAERNTSDFSLQVSTDNEKWITVDSITGNTADTTDRMLLYPYNARYVRLSITKASSEPDSQARARISQLELYLDDQVGQSLIDGEKGVTLEASSDPYNLAKTLLTDTFTQGNDFNGWVSVHAQMPQYVTFDLQSEKTFDTWGFLHSGDEGLIADLVRLGNKNADNASYKDSLGNVGYRRFKTRKFRIQISNDNKSWKDIVVKTDNAASKNLEKLTEPISARYVRLYIEQGQQIAADDQRARVPKFYLFDSSSLSYESLPIKTGSPKPVENTPPVTTDFYETLDIAKAEISTDLNLGASAFNMKNIISANKNIMITQITSTGSVPQTLSASPWTKKLEKNPEFKAQSGTDGNAAWASRTSNVQDVNGNRAQWMSEFAVASKIIGADTQSISSAENAGELTFTVNPGETVYIVSAVNAVGNQEISAPDGAAGAAVQSVLNLLHEVNSKKDIDKIITDHQNWWRDYYKLSYVDLGDNALNRTYYGSQYIFGCCTREGSTAPGLYGVWMTTDSANWQGDYHMNYNFQSPYYGSYSSNRLKEFSGSMFEAILNYIDAGKERAKNPDHLKSIHPWYFSTRPDLANGIDDAVLFPVGVTPYSQSSASASYLNQTLNALFCASQILAYYQYTLDIDTLMEKHTTITGSQYSMYDFLVLVANFYEKWVEKRGVRIDQEYIKDSKCSDDGYTQTHPTDYTKNYEKYPPYEEGKDYTYVLFDGCHEGSFEFNSTVTVGNLQNLLDTLVDIGEDYAPSQEKYNIWKDMADHLVKPETSIYTYQGFNSASKNSVNAGREIFGLSEDRKIRPISATVNLEFIQPGEQLSFDSDPYLLEVARNTVAVMGDDCLTYSGSSRGWNSVNNTPKIFTQAARVGYDADTLLSKINTYVTNKMTRSYYVDDKTHGWEKVGVSEAFNSMLLQNSDGILKVFPNWPAERDASFSTLRAKGAYLVSASQTEGLVDFIDIVSEKGLPVNIVSPWTHAVITDEDGKTVTYTTGSTKNTGEITLQFQAESGKTYHIAEDTSIPVIRSLEPVQVSTEVGATPVMPQTVTALYSDNTKKAVPVSWDPIDDSLYQSRGIFTVYGTVADTTLKAQCTVQVGDVLIIADDQFDLLSSSQLSALGWNGFTDTTDSKNQLDAKNGAITVENGRLTIKKTSDPSTESGYGAKRTFLEIQKDFNEGDGRIQIWTDQLRGTYDVIFSGCTLNPGSKTLWLDFTGTYNTNTHSRVARMRADASGIGPYNNNLNGIGTANYVHSDISDKTDYRIRFDMASKTYQIFLNGSSVPAKTINTAANPNNVFDMTDYGKRNSIEYMDGILFNLPKDIGKDTTAAAMDGFQVVKIADFADPVVDNAEAQLIMADITPTPEAVTALKPLPSELGGAKITWSSDRTDIITTDGTLIIPPSDTDVYLTAQIQNPETGYHKYKVFRLTVKGDSTADILSITQDGVPVTGLNEILGKTVSVLSQEKAGVLITASYQADGTLLSLAYGDAANTLIAEIPQNADIVKVFLWESAENLKPIAYRFYS